MLTLEASWLLGGTEGRQEGFLSMASDSLGISGEVVVGGLFWFLLSSITVAYTSGGGELVCLLAAALGVTLPQSAGSALFLASFAALGVAGTSWVDTLNRGMVLALVLSFLGLVGIGLPMLDTSLLLRASWAQVWPSAVSIGVIAFGAQNIVPTLLSYLGGDPLRTKRSVLCFCCVVVLVWLFCSTCLDTSVQDARLWMSPSASWLSYRACLKDSCQVTHVYIILSPACMLRECAASLLS
jgi:amino acid permease